MGKGKVGELLRLVTQVLHDGVHQRVMALGQPLVHLDEGEVVVDQFGLAYGRLGVVRLGWVVGEPGERLGLNECCRRRTPGRGRG